MECQSDTEDFLDEDYILNALLRVGDVVLRRGRHHAQHSLIFDKHEGTVWLLSKFIFIDTSLLDEYAAIVDNPETSFIQKQIEIEQYDEKIKEMKHEGTFVRIIIDDLSIKCVKYGEDCYFYKNYLIERAKPRELLFIAPKRFTSFSKFDLKSFSYFDEYNEPYEDLANRVGELLTREFCLMPHIVLTFFPRLEEYEPSDDLLAQYFEEVGEMEEGRQTNFHEQILDDSDMNDESTEKIEANMEAINFVLEQLDEIEENQRELEAMAAMEEPDIQPEEPPSQQVQELTTEKPKRKPGRPPKTATACQPTKAQQESYLKGKRQKKYLMKDLKSAAPRLYSGNESQQRPKKSKQGLDNIEDHNPAIAAHVAYIDREMVKELEDDRNKLENGHQDFKFDNLQEPEILYRTIIKAKKKSKTLQIEKDEEEEEEEEELGEYDDTESKQYTVITPEPVTLEIGQTFPTSLAAHDAIVASNPGHFHRQLPYDGKLIFRCRTVSCPFNAEFGQDDESKQYVLIAYTPHDCIEIQIPKSVLDSRMQQLGQLKKIDDTIVKQINDYFHLEPNTISALRIRRSYNRVHGFTRRRRLDTWGSFESFFQVVVEYGGKTSIVKDEDGHIKFVGMVPGYSLQFMHSDLFFPVVQLDTRFQTGISKGHLYALVTLTGNRTILPLAAAWSPGETKEATKMFFDMIPDEVELIESCHTDQSQALIGGVEETGMFNILCSFHMALNVPSGEKKIFIELVTSQTPEEYFDKKNYIIKNRPKLKEYLDLNNKWSKISRFEPPHHKRDLNSATTIIESFNAMIKRCFLHKAEPLIVFRAIWNIGYFAIEKILNSPDDAVFTNSVENWLPQALFISHRLVVRHNQQFDRLYLVSASLGSPHETCEVVLNANGYPSCSCGFFEDCGMPCIHIIAYAIVNQIDWTGWIHPRFIIETYRRVFHDLKYPHFFIVKTNDDIPVTIASLQQRQTRIPNPAEPTKKTRKKSQKALTIDN